MPCQELVECVTLYLEGSLSRADHARFDEHLEECAACTLYLEQLRQTIALAGRLRPNDISDEMRGELIHVFGEWRREGAGA